MAAEHLVYFNRHIRRFPARPERGRGTGSNLVRLLGALYVDNRVSGWNSFDSGNTPSVTGSTNFQATIKPPTRPFSPRRFTDYKIGH
jgi:hypothetical protein